MPPPTPNKNWTLLLAAILGGASGVASYQVQIRVDPPRPDPFTGSQATVLNGALRNEIATVRGKVEILERMVAKFSTAGPEEVRKALERQELLLQRIYELNVEHNRAHEH